MRTKRNEPPEPTAYFVLVTPAMANEWLGRNNLNRRQRGGVVDRYARDIDNGNWLLTGSGVQFDWNGELLDGQHRLSAIVQARKPAYLLVVYNLDPAVRDVIDQGAKRTSADVLDFKEVKNSAAVAAIAAKAISWDRGFRWLNNYRPTVSEIVDYSERVDNWMLHRAAEVYNVARARVDCRPTVFGLAFFLCARVDPKDAERFYVDQLVDNVGLAKGEPAHTLLRKMSNMPHVKGERDDFRRLAFILLAWNKFRDGESAMAFVEPRPDGWSQDNYPVPR